MQNISLSSKCPAFDSIFRLRLASLRVVEERSGGLKNLSVFSSFSGPDFKNSETHQFCEHFGF
jgi:hypothetical protein